MLLYKITPKKARTVPDFGEKLYNQQEDRFGGIKWD
jgi:hypothetical protein